MRPSAEIVLSSTVSDPLPGHANSFDEYLNNGFNYRQAVKTVPCINEFPMSPGIYIFFTGRGNGLGELFASKSQI